MRKIVSLITVVLIGMNLQAQTQAELNNKLNSWSVGINTGHIYDLFVTSRDGDQASGDLKGLNGDKTSFDLGYGIYVEKQFNPLFGLQLGFNGGNITGANEFEYYEGSFSDLNLNMTFNFSNLGLKNMQSPWNFYARTGLGLLSYTSERFLIFDDASNNEEESSTLSTNLGLGLRYQINTHWRAELQTNYQAVFNDGFDGWDYGSGADQFIYTSLGVAYTFGDSKKSSMEQVNFFSDEYLSISQGKPAVVNEIDTALINQLEAQLEEEKAAAEKRQELIIEQGKLIDQQQKRLAALESRKNTSVSTENRSIYFESTSFKLTKEAEKELMALALALHTNDQLKVTIVAYTDQYGEEKYNAQLRNKRAESVMRFLMNKMDIPSNRISKQMKNETLKGESIQHLNRRVDLEIH